MVPIDEEAEQLACQEARIALGQRQDELNFGPWAPDSEIDNYFPPGVGFEFKEIRIAFVGRVYSLLAFQQLGVLGIVALLHLNSPIKEWIGNNSWTFVGSFLLAFFTLIVFHFCRKFQRSYPRNIIPLIFYAVTEGMFLGCAGIFFSKMDAILIGVGFVIFICCSLALFTFLGWDFTKRLIGIFICILIVMGTLVVFLCGLIPIGQVVAITAITTCAIGSSVIGMNRILAKEHRKDINPEDSVFAALTLYVDVFCIFTWI